MQDVYKNIDEYNNNSIMTDLFNRGRKLNICVVFITQSYFKVPKNARLIFAHLFIMNIPPKKESFNK